jgi:hypothetical protein
LQPRSDGSKNASIAASVAPARRVEGDIAHAAAEVEPLLAGDGRDPLDEGDVHGADRVGDVLEGAEPHITA